ncbi:MAG: tyrosine-type recombinase/integrase [bacterium]
MAISKLSLFKRSNGFWYILFTDEGKIRWKSTGQTHKREALRALTEFETLLRAKQIPKNLEQFIREFLQYARGNYSPGTVYLYELALNHFLVVTGNIPLSKVTAKHFDLYRIKRLEAISPVTVNIELRTLRAFLNTALRWNLIEKNPFSGLKLVMVPEQTPIFFTRDDFQKLMNIIKEQCLREVVLFATLTGLRRGEIINLRWSDVDLPRKVITVQSNPTFRTKQGKRRVIPLSETAIYLLHSKCSKVYGEYVFLLNGQKISEDWLTHAFKDAVISAKLIDKRLHFHSLRHTFATWLVQDGVPIYEIQKLLGHSSIAVTQIYSHLAASELHKTVNRLHIELN